MSDLPAAVEAAIVEEAQDRAIDENIAAANRQANETELARIDADVAKAAIEADAAVAIAEAQAGAAATEEDDDAWQTIEEALIRLIESLERQETAVMALHRRFDEADGRRAGREESEPAVAIIEPEPPAPAPAVPAEPPAEPSGERRRRRLII